VIGQHRTSHATSAPKISTTITRVQIANMLIASFAVARFERAC
jgi:hypothetical protein